MRSMTDVRHEHAPQRWETNRVEAFSDGVFAIAITLLVLEIKVAPSDFEHLGRALVDEWPAYLAYVTSFLTVGSVWIAHHDLFTRLRFIDPVMLRLNLLLLMAAAFLPFPTAVLAQSFDASDQAERVAVAFYGLTALVIELLLRAFMRYADSRPDLAVARIRRARARAAARARMACGTERPALRRWRSSPGLFVFPKLAAAGYLVVAVRGVLVVGGQGRLGLRWLRAK